jgi:rhodanese-related sulfurtransferase
VTLATAIKKLTPNEALVFIDGGAAYVDLRNVRDYLDVHIPGSLSLQYEFGPGLPGRARDCVPLHIPLVLLEEDGIDAEEVVAALRGKGFAVEGVLEGGIQAWGNAHGTPASTDVMEGDASPEGTILDVNDPGAVHAEGALHIPIEHLWHEAGKIPLDRPAVVAAGHGLRAALAVGILERAGIDELSFWWRMRTPARPEDVKRRSFLHPFSD